jgi:uncharacterized protein YutE (UPF0331/DUF86 family)
MSASATWLLGLAQRLISLRRVRVTRLGNAAGLRNLLVHDYGDIDHARLWDTLGELDDLRSFASVAERLAQAG